MDIGFLFGWAKEQGVDLPTKDDGNINVPAALALYNDYNRRDNKAKEQEDSDEQPEDITELLGEEFKGVKGQQAVDKLMQEKRGHVKGAFHREDIGDIDLIWGGDTCGLQHILSRREEQGINAREFVQDLAEVVEKGQYRRRNDRGNFEFLHGRKMAVISPELRGNKLTFLVTAFKTRREPR